MKREELTGYLDQILESARFRDYCPNGLQVEGRADVQRIVAGVTASQALLDVAIARGADTLLVHHGWFWRGEDGRVTGFRKARMQALLKHDINLIAYHLPLDAHIHLGNNVQLGKRLGLTGVAPIESDNPECLIFHGYLPEAIFASELAEHISTALLRTPLISHQPEQKIQHVAWCSGGAQNYLQQAIEYGVDAYISGEVSEHTIHTARENNVVFYAAGHHATERYGVKALGEWLQQQFNELEVQFIDIDNPA